MALRQIPTEFHFFYDYLGGENNIFPVDVHGHVTDDERINVHLVFDSVY